jgi:hypothetical protein
MSVIGQASEGVHDVSAILAVRNRQFILTIRPTQRQFDLAAARALRSIRDASSMNPRCSRVAWSSLFCGWGKLGSQAVSR